MVEIGRIDIITEVSMLASCVAAPRRGQLDTIFHMFAYLEKKHKSRLVFDPTYPQINMDEFKECDWKEYYGEVTEAIPPMRPSLEVKMWIFVCLLILIMQVTRKPDS
jgi:hypothetical protein